MSIKGLEFHPIMGESLNDSNTILMDMSENNLALKQIDLLDTPAFEAYVSALLKQNKKGLESEVTWKNAIFTKEARFLRKRPIQNTETFT
ncbi:hypothetical protein [Cyclobacterium qasimii]|uniref:Uncharacterized protein n=1 Tax=Cyclobacterium qasimii M12-11B TaxID=641524 RepID=S7WQA5_9BACT|nr:hypothetical protein [Cyclobacterium qasimii]EPR68939.1 hypothetical protein ADICYQ_2026 [Cyclobacterium qasimii M12-11B]